jgi:[FeFe] hydrogenase H-cluster maturation GTPase HydF
MKTQRGIRPHISFFGRRNAGKSSLLNAITAQSVAIVSDVAGTTTDPVEKLMEFLPLGPVVFIDTAGIDDTGELGAARIERTYGVLEKTDVAVLVADPRNWGAVEDALLAKLQEEDIPLLVALNKSDLDGEGAATPARLKNLDIPVISVSASKCLGLEDFRDALIEAVPESLIQTPSVIGDLISAGETAVLVVPIDMEAPKGRLILPQVQVIRDLLDHDAAAIVVKERELRRMLDGLGEPPAIVVTDSQAFLKVAADVPDGVRMTSFSVLFARQKGDLNTFVEGALAIDDLRDGSRILIAESCTHHPVGDDIGRIKIPRWLTQYIGGKLDVDVVAGQDFPDNLAEYDLVVHCGSCMMNRRLVLSRIAKCKQAGVPITNYGLAIAKSLGILERALSPFDGALEILEKKMC